MNKKEYPPKFILRDWTNGTLNDQEHWLNLFVGEGQYKFHSRDSGIYVFELNDNFYKLVDNNQPTILNG